MSLSSTDNLFIFGGAYDSVESAEADYEAVKMLHSLDVIGTYDAAVLTKTEEGKPKIVHTTEKPTQHGGWGGLAVGAAIGVIFPPAIIGSAIAGAAVGAIGGHITGGLPHGDLKELADLIDEDEAALIVIGEPTIEEAVEKAMSRAKREAKKEVRADAREIEKEIDALAV